MNLLRSKYLLCTRAHIHCVDAIVQEDADKDEMKVMIMLEHDI